MNASTKADLRRAGVKKCGCNNFENGNPLLWPGYIFDAAEEGRSN
ncbi:hypothetical protein KYE_05291 [Marinobacter manganoxydans MnI7-9]|uniref:Uncharacterized protein n=1 Tax=Marinobacter manganoxydans MnI7-9 TaxID=1094979 RepID=G6YQE3_9GAMM|nr:hypothetical protein KYE_05291 [Marinobacter manganoxydans MnI7-9]